jgi:hypothetical protein
MFNYIIHIVVFQLLFLIVYDAFLKNETFFNWNRVYLLVTAILSVSIPLIKISSFSHIISNQYIVNLPEIIIGNPTQQEWTATTLAPLITDQKYFWTWEIVFYIGVLVSLVLFVVKLINILLLIKNNPKHREGNSIIVSLLRSNNAFSFFNYIFLGELLKKEEREVVLKHEQVHVMHKHTLDLLFFELFRVLFWFNPLVHIYQNRIMSLHEYIADAQAVKSQSKNQYYQSLLSQVFETKNISFINPFFKKSLIKKRIIMLQKTKSKQVKLVKYVLLFPIIIGMLIYTSCLDATNNKKNNVSVNQETNNETTLIKKIKALRHQIEVQGNLNENEEKGLSLLLKTIKGTDFNKELLDEVNAYTSQKTSSELVKKIAAVFEQIQVQGNISDAEDIALKSFLVLTSDNGFNDPFFADVIKHVDIPFGVIEQPPVYPGCENLPADEQKKCMAKNISRHVGNTFNTKLADSLKLTGRQRIYVIFKISNTGNVVDVRSRAPHPSLEAEAIRVINTLPKFTPGEHQGKKVNVLYSLPIIFEIAENKPKQE